MSVRHLSLSGRREGGVHSSSLSGRREGGVRSSIFLPFFLAVAVSAFEIINVTEYTVPGGIVKIIVKSDNVCGAQFLGKKYPLFREGEFFVGVIPVKMGISGRTKLTIIEKRFFRKNKKTEREIVVQKKKFEVSKISLDRNKIPAYLKQERKNLQSKLRGFSKRKFFEDFFYPLKKFNIVGEFGSLRVDRKGRELWRHKGVDLAAPTGTPVSPVAGGKVILILENSPVHGNAVLVDHGRGIKSIYIHLSEIDCRKGEVLDENSVLGKVGSTGISTGPHLHLGIYLFGVPVDPVYALKVL